jgi:hypothetical protein
MDKNMRVLCITAITIALIFKYSLSAYSALVDAKNAFSKVLND